MPAINFGLLAKLAAATIEGNLDDVLTKKLDELGEDFLTKQLGGQFGALERLAQGIDTRGQSEFDRLRNQWMSKAKGPSLPGQSIVNKIFNTLDKASGSGRSGQNRYNGARWAKSEWARSRNDWLDNHWKHDWRSQPRNARGEWIPGRLDYVQTQLRYKGTKPGRRTKRRRKLRRQARMRGKKAARMLFRKK
jgi:hypothetical protein